MARLLRVCPAGTVFHVLNRAGGRRRLFRKAGDYYAFMRVFDLAWEAIPIPILAMVVMPTHWHFVVRPVSDGQVSTFFKRLTETHAERWQVYNRCVGTGHVYQNRFKSFPVQDEGYLFTVIRYVERNPVRAGLVRRAERWPWGSARVRFRRKPVSVRWLTPLHLSHHPHLWRAWVNGPEPGGETDAVRLCIRRSRPFGNLAWVSLKATQLGLEATLRDPRRPADTG